MAKMTDEEWQNLYENFETYDLLTALEHLDTVRGVLADGEHLEPPQIRTDLWKLHQLAMDVVNNGWTRNAREMFHLAHELDMQVFGMVESLEYVQDTLSRLTDLFPESLMHEDEEEE